jgi:hypothetical protein
LLKGPVAQDFEFFEFFYIKLTHLEPRFISLTNFGFGFKFDEIFKLENWLTAVEYSDKSGANVKLGKFFGMDLTGPG